MNKPKWTATKKECSVDLEGKLKTKKITFEKLKKDLLPPNREKKLKQLMIPELYSSEYLTQLLTPEA